VDLDIVFSVARQFSAKGEVLGVKEYGSGNVNDTFLVSTGGSNGSQFILQKINAAVFPQPELIMHNLHILTEHVNKRLRQEPQQPGRRWDIPNIIRTAAGQDFFIDSQGGFWRAISFIAKAVAHDKVQNISHAREAGYAVGRFHRLIHDLAPDNLYDTLVGFHITPQYFRHYEKVLQHRPAAAQSPDIRYCSEFIESRREFATTLENAKQSNKLPVRPIHGDPKISNILLDEETGEAVSLIDLDTVKPGLIHYDLGDCLRSCCNTAGEEADTLQEVSFEPELCKTILGGYQSEARAFLTAYDYEYLYDAVRLLPFELGLRFFTDYLEGNVYFKVKHREHNLWRALVQFKLTQSIEAQEAAIRNIIRDLQ